MVQTNVKIEETQAEFLKRYSQYGFKDKNELVREALNRLREDLEQKSLRESAELYAEVYQNDADLQELTESALLDLPE
jgi:Arc/MetJ-type ribon-helix-helix transcriptional regulator